ncbi:MAG: hypothetical protein IKJ77_06490 [Firmicutes bacterium]|nr:hypothetical protein [Bacillota bacterium]
MKKILSVLLSAALLLTGIAFVPEVSYAAQKPSDWYHTGAECTSNAAAASTIDYIQAKYPTGSVYKGSGECWGWTEKICNMLAAKRSTKSYSGLKFNKKNLIAKCKGVKAGTHLRVSDGKTTNGYSGHSICLLKVTKDTVSWTDANVGGIYNGIRHKTASIDTFLMQYPFKYINFITKNLSYKAQSSEPLLAIKRADDGKGTLYWAKSSATSKYKVYRATSKNGKYKLVKTTTGSNYTDAKAPLGKKYYYKVKALKKNGSKTDSDKKSFTARLRAPEILGYSTNNSQGRIELSWTSVKGADKYKVYRYKYREKDKKWTFKYLATTKSTTYKDKSATNPKDAYCYEVVAVYAKNTKGNSPRSISYDFCHCNLAAPAITAFHDETANTLTISWNKVPYAKGYSVNAYPYWIDLPGYLTKTSYTFNLADLTPGETYEFWVNAYESKNDYDSYWGQSSMESNVVSFTVPGEAAPDDGGYDYWL